MKYGWINARALWGIPNTEKLTPESLWSRVHPDDLPAVRAAFKDALDHKSEDGRYATEFRVLSDNGRNCWLRAKGKAFFITDQTERHAERLVATIQDITEAKAWEANQRLLLSELSHRVKNTLAVVQSMARLTFRRTSDPKQALSSFEGRLGALSSAHDLLVMNDWQGAQLEALVRRQLGAQLFEDMGRLKLDGPPVMLPATLATPFGLLLHELGTNALKYGALSIDTGTVSLTWRLLPDAPHPTLEVNWREAGAPSPNKQSKAGFGTYLIEMGLPGAKVAKENLRDGLNYRIEVQLQDLAPEEK